MRKRPNRKRPKRSNSGQVSQRRQKLSRQVRELYPSHAIDGGPDGEWDAELQAELETAPPSRKPKRQARSSTPSLGRVSQSVDETTPGPEQTGRIVAISSGLCHVDSPNGEVDCVLPSDLARDQQATVAVGDEVTFTAHGEHAYRLCKVLPRRTILTRPDPRNPRRQRVIAANIDTAVHVASVVEPPLRPALIDRYLIAIERGGADAIICVNKIDLLPDTHTRHQALTQLSGYSHMGIAVLPCSTVTGEGLEQLSALLAQRTAVFVGHSGVGKSSLLNALGSRFLAATGPVSSSFGTGRHTTTRSNLYRLAAGIQIIDTPGIREFGLWKLTTAELKAYFPEFEQLASGCRFSDCGHSHEPRCAVQAAVEAGTLLPARYQTYLRILSSLQDEEIHRGQ